MSFKTRGLKRGDALENLLDFTNEYYRRLGLARVDKAATPVKVVEINSEGQVAKVILKKVYCGLL